MSDPATEHFLVREESVQRLERIVFALTEAARRCEAPAQRIRDALPLSLAAECVDCGIRLTGEELLLLSRLPRATEVDRLKRLRAGHCARAGCECDQYRLFFQNHPDLDWTKLFSAGEEVKAELSGSGEAEPGAADGDRRAVRRRKAIRIVLLIGAGVLLFVLRQLYLGGRIPLIREPEKFRVDPAPPGADAQ
jgi:hypothetical protein